MAADHGTPVEVDAGGRTVTISSPDKVMFPERGETKLDLARYYVTVGEPLMRTVRDRPTLLQRWPNGATGQSFFQKRIPASAPEWLQTTTVSTPNGTTSRAIVMADVAIAAGVSHMTVSRVLNGTARVSPATRARVEEALRTLGYRPNAAARALATGRSGQLSVVFFDTTLFGPASALFAIEQAARREGYSVNIVSLPRIDPTTMRDAVAQLRAQAVDGTIIVAPHTSSATALREVPADLPAVVVGGGDTADLPVVAIDQEAGGIGSSPSRLVPSGEPAAQDPLGPQPKLPPDRIRFSSSVHSGPFSVSHSRSVSGSKASPNEFRIP